MSATKGADRPRPLERFQVTLEDGVITYWVNEADAVTALRQYVVLDSRKREVGHMLYNGATFTAFSVLRPDLHLSQQSIGDFSTNEIAREHGLMRAVHDIHWSVRPPPGTGIKALPSTPAIAPK